MSAKKRKIDVEKGTKAGQDETKSDEKFGKNKKSHKHNKVVFSKHATSVKDNHSEQSAERKQHRSDGYESDNDTRRRNSNSNSKLIAVGITIVKCNNKIWQPADDHYTPRDKHCNG
jgi:hypothetical protein